MDTTLYQLYCSECHGSLITKFEIEGTGTIYFEMDLHGPQSVLYPHIDITKFKATDMWCEKCKKAYFSPDKYGHRIMVPNVINDLWGEYPPMVHDG